jgi:diguanylate cyclase (GGDEF)-like protein
MCPVADEAEALRAAYLATRNLLQARDAASAQHVVLTLCRALGAAVATADADVPDSVPMDISLGEGVPLLPVTGDPLVLSLVRRYLAPAVADARSAVERWRAEERLLQRATMDVLTGVWGRRSLMFAINHARPGDCVALIDLDHFKSINDTLGHDTGDTALASFAAHLRGTIRDRDIVGRYGGDEFVVVFPATTLGDAHDVMRRLRQSWRASSSVHVTFSAGIIRVEEADCVGEQRGKSALRAADALMYLAKAAGRDRVECRSVAPAGGTLYAGAGS